MNETMHELSTKVDQLAGRFDKIEDAMLKVVQIQVELAQVIRSNDKRDEMTEKLNERVFELEKSVNVNSLTLAKSERFFWIVVAVAATAIGKLVI